MDILLARQLLPMTGVLRLFCQFMLETQIQNICYCMSLVCPSALVMISSHHSAVCHETDSDGLIGCSFLREAEFSSARWNDVRSRDERRAWIIMFSPRRWLITKRKWLFIMIVTALITQFDMNPIKTESKWTEIKFDHLAYTEFRVDFFFLVFAWITLLET